MSTVNIVKEARYSPPCLGKLESIKTITLIPAQIMGVQVDIRKFAASYVAPTL